VTRPELRPLTSIRGLFAWVVVLYHIRLACLGWLPIGVIHALAKGYLAVDFFFLLSGFVIWLNYGERLRRRGAASDFLVRRIARIWPLHAVMLAFAAAIALLLLATGRQTDHFPFKLLPLYLALMQDWGWSNALLWNDPAWSISGEWAAYLVTPLVVLALPARRWSTPALMIAAATPLLLLFALLSWGHGGLGFSISEFGLPRCLAEFSCGTMLSELWRRWRGSRRIEAVCWIVALALLAAWWAGVPEALALPFAFAALLQALALGAERPHHLLAGRAIHWLGEISYATYLSHFLLFFAFKLAFVRDAFDVPPALIAAYLLLVLFASAVLYHGVERPAQRVILQYWKRFRDGSPVVSRGPPAKAEAQGCEHNA
jgi:peptidoglycan/LPS O-acetylase OafA/YrhL